MKRDSFNRFAPRIAEPEWVVGWVAIGRFLGVCDKTARKLGIPVYEFGGKARIRRVELRAWVESCRRAI